MVDAALGLSFAASLCLGLLVLALAICWAVLPFILIRKLNAQREATDAATKELSHALGKVAQSTRQTAEACAALTVWAERAEKGQRTREAT